MEKRKRGFAAMSPERRKEAAQRGITRLRELGKAHKWDSVSGKAARKRVGKVGEDGTKV